ncbi:MAG: HNH endonuclease [Prevotella sp.]|nr:HNH endonuclease [Prevotella sp.]
MARDNWTEEQITVVLYEYCRNPFGQFSATKQFVVELGKLLGRTPGAIVRKVGNLASFDPQMKARGVGGLGHTGKLDEIVWNKYFGHWDKLAFDAEVLIAKYQQKGLEESLTETINLNNLPKGKERKQEVTRRINQDFFRRTVLSSYNNCCCITGINNKSLLEASHIVGWTKDEANRTNPQNGLCLNVLFHKAYDENLIGISPDYEIFISDKFFGKMYAEVDNSTMEYIQSFNGRKLILPRRFFPDKDFLALHYEQYCSSI